MLLSQALQNFEIDKLCEGRTQKTIKNYTDNTNWLILYLGDMDLSQLTLDHVKSFVVYLNQKGTLSKTSIQTYVRHIKVFLNWLYDNELTSVDFPRFLKLPAGEKLVKNVLGDEEVQQIFLYFRGSKSFSSLRSRAIISLFLTTGIRADELLGIKMSDINFPNRYLKVYGKGSKERFVRLQLCTLKCINDYLPKRYFSDFLFTNDDGSPMSYSALRNCINRIKRKPEINIPRLTCHLMRHTYATRAVYLKELNLFELQVSLGHETLDQTRKYSHLASQLQVCSVKFLPWSELIR